MAQLSQAKTLGGVGSILMLLAVIPVVGWVLSIAGAIMVLLAIKHVSDIVQDKSIFNNMVIAIVLSIIGVVVGVAVIFGTMFTTLGLGAYAGRFPSFSTPPTFPAGDWMGLMLGALTGLAIIWVLLLVSAIFVRKSYETTAKKLGVSMFGTAGLLYLIGAALTIVLVGFVLLFVALILNIVAFFSIPDQPMPMQASQPQPATM
ncbi:MAG: DUF996 domain-containing protein [Nitrososphaerales archaeon]|nr:DUF996 domain-containing protein [Nitrososphaerales archaeon]